MFIFTKTLHVFGNIAILKTSYFMKHYHQDLKINWLINWLIITDTNIAKMWLINRFPIIKPIIGTSLNINILRIVHCKLKLHNIVSVHYISQAF